MFSEGLPGGLGIFRGRFMGEVCMMKQVRFHLNFRYEDSVVSRSMELVFPLSADCFLATVFIRFVNASSRFIKPCRNQLAPGRL